MDPKTIAIKVLLVVVGLAVGKIAAKALKGAGVNLLA